MERSLKLEKQIAKQESDKARNEKKSCIPTDNYGDRYVTVLEKLRTQGKGSKVRDISGWYSEETTLKLEKIFGKKKAK